MESVQILSVSFKLLKHEMKVLAGKVRLDVKRKQRDLFLSAGAVGGGRCRSVLVAQPVLLTTRGALQPAPALRLHYAPIPPSASQSVPVPAGSQSSSFCMCACLYIYLGMLQLQFGCCSSAWGVPNCRTLHLIDFPKPEPCLSITWAFHHS